MEFSETFGSYTESIVTQSYFILGGTLYCSNDVEKSQVQRKATKIIYEERLREQGMVILEKRKLVDRRKELFDSTIQILEGV